MIYQIQTDLKEINAQNVNKWVNDFINNIQPRRIDLGKYYDGKNAIVKQGAVANRPNYSININMAKYITDVATAYAFGKDITYATENETTQVTLDLIGDIFKNTKASEVDFNIGGDMSCYGIGYQMILIKEGQEPIEDRIVLKKLNSEQTFYVVDNTLLNEPICAIYFYKYKQGETYKTRCYVYDKELFYEFDGAEGNFTQINESIPHLMGNIPILQSLNNDDAMGDYECVKDILDALSLCTSNNTDDLQSIANALLSVQGAILNEGGIKEVNSTHVMNVPVGSKVEWVIKNINPEANKQQIDTLLAFLFQISQVPDLSDDAFGGNQSGVAMQYKLWGINQLWSTKVKKYTNTLYDRLQILLHLLQNTITRQIDLLNEIDIMFYKNLPTDANETYAMVQALKGTVSEKTLLENIPIVDDVDAEMEQIKKERQEEADDFGFNNNQELKDEE